MMDNTRISDGYKSRVHSQGRSGFLGIRYTGAF